MTRLRTPLLLAAAVTLALPAAAPAATTAVRAYAETGVSLIGGDGATYYVSVGAYGPEEVDGHPPMLRVLVRRCTGRGPASCPVVLDARRPVAAAAVTIAADLSSARLSTTLDGEPLTVSWTATADPPVVPGLQVWDTPTVRVGPQRMARAVVSAFGTRCTGAGAVSREVTASTADLYAVRTGSVPAALSGDAAPRCRPEDPRR